MKTRKALEGKLKTGCGQSAGEPSCGIAVALRAVLVGALVPLASLAGDNLLVNGNFDSSTFAGEKNYVYSSTPGVAIPNWEFSTKNAGLTKSATFLASSAISGKYALFLQYTANEGEIYAEQEFAVSEPGIYRYSLLYAGRNYDQQPGTAFKVQLVDPSGSVKVLQEVTEWAKGTWMPCRGTVDLSATGNYTFRILVPAPTDGISPDNRMDVFDNVTFAKVVDGELVANGSFDEGVVPTTSQGGSRAASNVSGYDNTPWVTHPEGNTGLATAGAAFVPAGFEVGNYALYLQYTTANGTATAEQTISVDEAGIYNFQFDYAARAGQGGQKLEAHLINASDSTDMLVARVTTDASKLSRHSIPIRITEAGDYTIKFSFTGTVNDRSAVIDAVSFAKVADITTDNLLRNPGFDEGSIPSTAAYGKMSSDTTTNLYWTASIPANVGLTTQKGALLGSGSAYAACGTYAMFLQYLNTLTGDLYGEQEFIVTDAGDYRWSLLCAGRNSGDGGTGFQVSLIAPDDSTEIVLATVAAASVVKARWTPFHGTVALSAPGRYRFRLKTLAPEGVETFDRTDCFDNLTFTKVESDNLILNGSFDDGTVPSTSYYGNNAPASVSGYENPQWTTTPVANTGLAISGSTFIRTAHHVGTYALYLQTTHSVISAPAAEQTFTVTQTGMYQLSFNYTARAAYATLGGLPLLANIVDGTTTKTVASHALKDTGWYTSVSTVRLTPGDHTLQFIVPDDGVDGHDATWDRTAIVDNVRLVKVPSDMIYVATWNGSANDGNVANPANWTCYYADETVAEGCLPTGDTAVTFSGAIQNDITVSAPLSCKSIVFSSASLSDDCDWSGLGEVASMTGTLDLNGRRLTVSRLDGSFEMTGTSGELVVNVPSGTVSNRGVALSGGITVIKEGAGTFVSAKAQTYSGGTIANGGTIQPPDNANENTDYAYSNFKAFGTGAITINPRAVFDLRGNYAYRSHIDLAGGTLRNSGYDMTKTGWGGSGVGTLTADSFIDAASSIVFGDASATDGNTTDLGAHTLDATIADGKTLSTRVSRIMDGTLSVAGDGTFSIIYDLDMSDATLDAACAISVASGKTLAVRNYIARYAGSANGGDGALTVSGTFRPVEAGFFGATMLDGSAIDLSEWTDALPLNGLKFADDATVRLSLGGRKVPSNTKLVGWNEGEEPSNLRTIKFFTDDGVKLSRQSDGIYFSRRGLVIIFR